MSALRAILRMDREGEPLLSSLIRSPKDFCAALIYLAIGLGTILIGRDLRDGHCIPDGPSLLPDRPRGAAFIHRPDRVDPLVSRKRRARLRVHLEAACVYYQSRCRCSAFYIRGAGLAYRVAALRHDDRLCQHHSWLGTIAGAGRKYHGLLHARVREGFGRAVASSWVAGSAAGSPNDKSTFRSIVPLELITNLGLGLGTALTALQPALLFARCFPRHAGRHLAGPWPDSDHRHAAADHLRLAGGIGVIMLAGIYYGAHMEARRRPSWSTCRAKRPRSSRPSTDTRWPGKAARVGAGDGGDRFPLGRYHRDGLDRLVRAPARGGRPGFGPAEYFS